MKKFALYIPSLLLLAMIFISAFTNDSVRKLEPSDVNYNEKLNINSPEGLALASVNVYRDVLSGEISIDEAFEMLKSYAAEDSLDGIIKNQDKFKRDMKQNIDYMIENGIKIEKVEFAKTIYSSSQKASIERIQKLSNGRSYYFKQDFIYENGKWKIYGDNITDEFKIKWSLKHIFSRNYIV